MLENNEQDILGLDDVEAFNTPIDDIETESVCLMVILIDISSSMTPYMSIMKDSLESFKQAILDSKEADEILVARGNFGDTVSISGYKNIKEFDTSYNLETMTSLYDMVALANQRLVEYMDLLKNEGVRTKAVFAMFSDGEDTNSKTNVSDARSIIQDLNQKEITTAFVSFGWFGGADRTAQQLGFKNILKTGSSASELRKAFNCLSKSVIESSKSVAPDDDKFFI